MKFSEIITLIIASGVGLFILVQIRELRTLPSRRLMLTAYFLLWAAWVVTNLEELFLENILNHVEHLFQSVSSILLMIWVWRVLVRDKGAEL
jgi:hypothetical protein